MNADIYLDEMDLSRYWPEDAPLSFDRAMRDIAAGKSTLKDYPFLSPRLVKAYELVTGMKGLLPDVPMLTVPRPVAAEVIPLNSPGRDSPVLVTGNNEYTVSVLTAVWAHGSTPAHLLVLDCRGNTVDMAVVLGDFTGERLRQALDRHRVEDSVNHRHLIIPGWAARLADSFRECTGWEIESGPVCAAELPLALGDRWVFST